MTASSSEPDPDEALRALASHFVLEFIHELPAPSEGAIQALPSEIARRFHVAPVEFDGTGNSATLVIATSAPNNFDTIDSLCALLRRDLRFIAAPAREIERIIQHAYPPST